MKTLIIGSSGVGKTSFSRRLQEKREVPLCHLDSLWHKGDYSEEAKQIFWQEMITFMDENDSWIVDGNYAESLPLRLERADQVIWLKASRFTCLWRVLKRSFAFRQDRQSRHEMPDDFQEAFDKDYLAFLKFVWDFPKKTEPSLLKSLQLFKGEVVVLSGEKAIAQFLEKER